MHAMKRAKELPAQSAETWTVLVQFFFVHRAMRRISRGWSIAWNREGSCAAAPPHTIAG